MLFEMVLCFHESVLIKTSLEGTKEPHVKANQFINKYRVIWLLAAQYSIKTEAKGNKRFNTS